MKKLLIIGFAIMAYTLTLTAASESAELPDIESWQNGELRVTIFDTVSGNRGSWQEREYRTNLGTTVYAIWLEGAGEKGWNPPNGTILTDDGLLGRGAVYKTVVIASQNGMIEYHPVTGYSVAVKIAKIGTLTVESKYAEEDEILDAAERLVREITESQAN